jgi:hypothetical protein
MVKLPSAIDKPSNSRIMWERFLRFMKVGAFLHAMVMISVVILLVSAKIAMEFYLDGLYFKSMAWAALALWAFTVPFFSELDALGRYQNYKQIKDAMFEMGYDPRLVKPFMHSKCQRDAVIAAGEDLGCQEEVKRLFRDQGYRWYHVLPDAFVKNPLVLFYGMFWKRILFTKTYKLKNFYW